MHVSPGDFDPRKDRVVRGFLKDAEGPLSLSSQDLVEQRPGNRRIIADRLELLYQACHVHVTGEDAEGNPVIRDFRYLDLELRVLDRLAKVLEVLRPDAPSADEVPTGVRPAAAVAVSRQLEALEGRMAPGA